MGLHTRFSRRAFLRSTGAGLAMLPLLGDEVEAAGCVPAGRRRLITLAWGNGYQNWVQGSGAAFTLPEIMKPIEPHRADLLIPDALFAKTWDDAYPKSVPNEAHDSPMGQLCGKRMKRYLVADGPSVDYWIGSKLKQSTNAPWPVVNLGVKNAYRSWSWQGADALARPDDDPFHAFEALFAGAQPAGMATPSADTRRAVRKSVLDQVQKDLGRFARRLGKEDKVRIDAHLSSIREIEGRLSAPQLAESCAVPTLGARFDPKSSDNYEKTLRAQIDLGVAALAAGLSQVLTLTACNGTGAHVILTWLGLQATGKDAGAGGGDLNAHHAIAHSGGSRKDLIDRWFFQQFAYLLEKLKATKEGAGSLFDNSVVLVPNNMDHGNRHNVKNLPWILAGTAGGYFKTGRVIKADNAPTNQILVGLCNAMGVSPDGFADPTYGGELPGLRA